MNNTNVINKINEVYPNLTKSETKVANFVLSNTIAAQYMSITSLSEECTVSDATISRFCKTLGFKSYNEFKLAIAKSIGSKINSIETADHDKITLEDSILDMSRKLYTLDISSINQTLELLNPKDISTAVKYLHNASRVFTFGQGGSGVIAKEAWARFITATPQFQCIEDSHMQVIAASLCTSSDVILFFSYSGATKDVVEILSTARNRGARIILITHFPKCPAASYADVILLCGGQESPLNSGSIAAKMGQLFLIDVLFNEFCRMDIIHTNQNRETTSEALASKLI